MPKKINLAGKRFGRLLVVSETAKRDSSGNVYWQCKCDCGKSVAVASRSLRNGDNVSCGCYHRETVGKAQMTDLTALRFGRLVALQRGKIHPAQGSFWLCQCDCGHLKEIRQNSLVLGLSKSCGCLNLNTEKRRKSMAGQVVGRLLVIKYTRTARVGKGHGHDALWLCRCECGTEKEVRGRALRDGTTTSCGCYNREISTTHGLSQTREYRRAEAKRRALSKIQRTPAWANNQKILEFYKNRPQGMHVDHIIPLHHKLVSGLHVENNLQYLPDEDNLKKSNKFDPVSFAKEAHSNDR